MLILFYHAATNQKLDGNFKRSANVIHFLTLLACCQSFLGFLARHLNFVKPVKNRSCPSKWRAWQVLAKALSSSKGALMDLDLHALDFISIWEDLWSRTLIMCGIFSCDLLMCEYELKMHKCNWIKTTIYTTVYSFNF